MSAADIVSHALFAGICSALAYYLSGFACAAWDDFKDYRARMRHRDLMVWTYETPYPEEPLPLGCLVSAEPLSVNRYDYCVAWAKLMNSGAAVRQGDRFVLVGQRFERI